MSHSPRLGSTSGGVLCAPLWVEENARAADALTEPKVTAWINTKVGCVTSVSCKFDNSSLDANGDSMGTIVSSEFVHDVSKVAFHCIFADSQGDSGILVR